MQIANAREVDVSVKTYPSLLRDQVDQLDQLYHDLEEKCTRLRCELMQSGSWSYFFPSSQSSSLRMELRARKIRASMNRSTVSISQMMESIPPLRRERERLQKRVEELTEENNDVYETLNSLTREKEELKSHLDDLCDELDTCNTVSHFLELERDNVKRELELMNDKMEKYHQQYLELRK